VTGERDDAIVLRDFRSDDLEAVLALRARVFPARDLERERRRWRWEFDENPFRRADVPIAWVFELDGKVVGNYGLVPTPVSIDRKAEFGLNGIDFVVAPELQGRKLGHRIAQRHMDPKLCAFPFLTAPTPAVAHLVEKHGGTLIRCADESSLWCFRCASDVPTPRPPREVALRPISGFEPRFDDLFDRVTRAKSHRVFVARDHRYLNWRYRDYPFGRPTIVSALGRDGLLRGFFVLQHDRAQDRGLLLELFADPREEWVVRGLVAGAIDAARAAKLGELHALHRSPAVQQLLAASGFTRVEGHSLTLACRLPTAAAGAPPITKEDVYWSAGDGDMLYGVGDLPTGGANG
jgi:GNAT superfamily N-acetyltransferase/N-acetylglutamate synthase-like GNAT family acetyltransferase